MPHYLKWVSPAQVYCLLELPVCLLALQANSLVCSLTSHSADETIALTIKLREIPSSLPLPCLDLCKLLFHIKCVNLSLNGGMLTHAFSSVVYFVIMYCICRVESGLDQLK